MRKKKFYLQAKSPLGQKIHTTKAYWNYISERKHPEVKGGKQKAIATIERPDIIKRSLKDPEIFAYYQKIKDKYFCLIAKHENGEGFVVTAYVARKITMGELVYQRSDTS